MPGDSAAEKKIAEAEDSVGTRAARGKGKGKGKKKPHAVVQLLERTIAARGWTIEEVCKALADPKNPTTLWRMLKGKIRPNFELIEEILDIIGEPRELFWGRYMDHESGLKPLGLGDLDYAHLMRQIAGRPATQLPEAVAKVLEAGLPALQDDPLEALPNRIHELDKLRLVDKEAASDQCLEWIKACHGRMLADRLEPRRLAELLTGLGNFASILRSRGESRLAAALLAEAFEAVSELHTGLAFASLLGRSAPVLTDGGYPKLALAVLHQARDILAVYNDPFEVIVAISLGGHYRYLAKYEQARRHYENALAHSGLSEDHEATVLSNLAQVLEETNQPDRALELIERLEAEGHEKKGRISTCMRWIKARALKECGEPEVAAEILADIRSEVERYCPAIDPLLHFFDYAEVLMRLGDQRRLAAATGIALDHLPQLCLDAKLLEATVRTLHRIENRSIQLPEIRRLRRRLASTNSA